MRAEWVFWSDGKGFLHSTFLISLRGLRGQTQASSVALICEKVLD